MRYYNRKISNKTHTQSLRNKIYVYGVSSGSTGSLFIIHRKHGRIFSYGSFPILKTSNMAFAHFVEGKRYAGRYRSHNYMGREANRP